MVPITTTDNF